MNKKSTYEEAYFNRRKNLSFSSAKKILGIVDDFYSFSSAVDFGCGTGTWLKACIELGCQTIQGFDGFADPNSLCISSEYFSQKLLGERIDLAKTYDLAICLEAAEHVEEKFSDLIVENLTNSSDVILFSAAIPGQGGTNHVNEQPPQYWAEKFANHGYDQFDVIRPLIWDEDDIAWWYKQNTFLYIYSDANRGIKLNGFDHGLSTKYIIHPQCLADKMEEFDIENASIKNLSKAIIKKFARKLSSSTL